LNLFVIDDLIILEFIKVTIRDLYIGGFEGGVVFIVIGFVKVVKEERGIMSTDC
jgi:hypothetical protein